MSSFRKYLPDEKEKLEIKREVKERTLKNIFYYTREDDSYMRRLLNETISAEIERWKNEREFPLSSFYIKYFKKVRQKLSKISDNERKYLLSQIVEIYMDEIQGHFSPLIYNLATKVVPQALSFMLTGLSLPNILIRLIELNLPSIDTHLIIDGNREKIVKLAKKGTIMLVPTHVSHMDSPLIGYVVYKLGLPPFLYGAGLNLFANPILGFFMKNLGAYKVDRKRKHKLYLDTLKEYVCATLEREYDHIFFPEGTRSRTGTFPEKLKMGILGCGLKSFINNLQMKKERPNIYIVPATFTYHLVLEAESLIKQYLEDTTKEDWVSYSDEAFKIPRIVDFIKRIVEMDIKVFVRLSDAFDPFGNYVDDDGNSLDPSGRPIDPKKYVIKDGNIVHDSQRDAEYTKELAGKILKTYRKDNMVLSTNLSCFTIFHLGMKKVEEDNEIRALSLMEGLEIDMKETLKYLEIAKEKFVELEKEDKIKVVDRVKVKTAGNIIDTAYRVFSKYHKIPPFTISKNKIKILNPPLLYYYRNRLKDYILLD